MSDSLHMCTLQEGFPEEAPFSVGFNAWESNLLLLGICYVLTSTSNEGGNSEQWVNICVLPGGKDQDDSE